MFHCKSGKVDVKTNVKDVERCDLHKKVQYSVRQHLSIWNQNVVHNSQMLISEFTKELLLVMNGSAQVACSSLQVDSYGNH